MRCEGEWFLTRFRRFARWLVAISALALTMPCFLQAQAKKERIVVVISLDGFPAYALQDPRLPIPTLRKLAREGVVADSMQPVNPTVTWPNHTAIVTGVDSSEHQVLFNGLLIRPGKETLRWPSSRGATKMSSFTPRRSTTRLTTQGSRPRRWIGLRSTTPRRSTGNFRSSLTPMVKLKGNSIANGTVTAEQLKTFEDSSQAWQDEIWTDAAVKILEEHQAEPAAVPPAYSGRYQPRLWPYESRGASRRWHISIHR